MNDQDKKMQKIKDIALNHHAMLLGVIEKSNEPMRMDVTTKKSRVMGVISSVVFFIGVFSLDLAVTIVSHYDHFYEDSKWIAWTALSTSIMIFLVAIFFAIMESKLRTIERKIPATISVIKYAKFVCFFSVAYLVISPSFLTQIHAMVFMINDEDLPGLRAIALLCLGSWSLVLFLEFYYREKIINWLAGSAW